jgi:aryl-alcohol dehydrogenase-like predicted oxidoreductase
VASLSGRAGVEGTRRAASRFGPRRDLGRTGLSVSAIGFAGHRALDDVLHARALRMALEAGINVVAVGGPAGEPGERLVGRVLGEVVTAGLATRDELVIVTRLGGEGDADRGAPRTDALAASLVGAREGNVDVLDAESPMTQRSVR